jgi:hypothetical protein
MDKFTQLVKDLDDGALSLSLLRNAYRQHIRNSNIYPEGIKDLLCGRSEADSGIITRHFQQLSIIIGSIELAYRRGTSDR